MRWDHEVASNLVRFGVPNVCYLPAAAQNDPRPPHPGAVSGRDDESEILFVGDATPSIWDIPGIDPRLRGVAVAAAGARTQDPRRSFYDFYHSVLEFAEPPSTADSAADREQKATEYFCARYLYCVELARLQRDRFVIFLANRFASRFRIIGQGWKERYGIVSQVRSANASGHHDSSLTWAGLHIAMAERQSDTALMPNHLDLLASGAPVARHSMLRSLPELQGETTALTFDDEDSLLQIVESSCDRAGGASVHGGASGNFAATIEQGHLAAHRWRALCEMMPDGNADRNDRTLAASRGGTGNAPQLMVQSPGKAS